jgi:hypothetical protein
MSSYEINFRNHFQCPNDGTAWDDEWDCMCNDRCPECDAEIEPYISDDLRSGERIIHAQIVYDKAVAARQEQENELDRQFSELMPNMAKLEDAGSGQSSESAAESVTTCTLVGSNPTVRRSNPLETDSGTGE